MSLLLDDHELREGGVDGVDGPDDETQPDELVPLGGLREVVSRFDIGP